MHLSIVSGPDAGAVFVVTPPNRLRVGRGAECELPLHDPSVSRLQFEIWFEHDRPVLLDPASRWGTLVNGMKVVRHELKPGDLIRVGDTDLRWMPGSNPAASTMAPVLRPITVFDDAKQSMSPPLERPASGLSQALDDDPLPHAECNRALDPAKLLGQVFADYLVQQVEANARTGVVFRAVDRD
ncbi:MAG: FHA domain-containing protein, partial [Planctomycetaceae bacterium]|nr:FHA domain-containing protein [Planctomycetaceae bacterium]